MGHKFVVCPWIEIPQRKEPRRLEARRAVFNQAGEAAQRRYSVAYHNHASIRALEAWVGNCLRFPACRAI